MASQIGTSYTGKIDVKAVDLDGDGTDEALLTHAWSSIMGPNSGTDLIVLKVDKGDVHDPATFAVLRQAIEAVQAHVEQEEGEIFPKLRQACGTEELHALAEKMEVAMKVAPTHPHPTTPNNPIGAAAAGMVTGAVDKLRDAVSSDR